MANEIKKIKEEKKTIEKAVDAAYQAWRNADNVSTSLIIFKSF